MKDMSWPCTLEEQEKVASKTIRSFVQEVSYDHPSGAIIDCCHAHKDQHRPLNSCTQKLVSLLRVGEAHSFRSLTEDDTRWHDAVGCSPDRYSRICLVDLEV